MDILQLLLRLVHVVAGALWVGMAVFIPMLLMPALQDSGPAGAPVMGALNRRGLMTILPILAIGTLLSGIWLYWRVSGGFDRAFMASRTGMALGTGGIAALVGFSIGMIVARPAMLRAAALMQSVGPSSSDAERSAALAEAARLRARGGAAARVVAILLLVAVAGMAVARYL